MYTLNTQTKTDLQNLINEIPVNSPVINKPVQHMTTTVKPSEPRKVRSKKRGRPSIKDSLARRGIYINDLSDLKKFKPINQAASEPTYIDNPEWEQRLSKCESRLVVVTDVLQEHNMKIDLVARAVKGIGASLTTI